MEIINLIQGSEAWKQARRNHVTGTDMAMVTREASWPRLKESKVNPSTFQSPAMARGNAFEGIALEALQAKTGIKYRPAVLVNRDAKILVSLDGLAALRVATCEIKIPEKGQASDLWIKAAQGKIPRRYYLQMQAGLMLSGAPVCHYWVYDPETQTGILQDVKADPKVHDEITQSVAAYWNWLGCNHDESMPAVNNRTGEIASKAEEHYIKLLAAKAKLDAEIKALEEQFIQRRKVGAPLTKGVLINISDEPKEGSISWKQIVEKELPDLDIEAYRKPSAGRSIKVQLNDSGKAYLQSTKEKATKHAIQKDDKAA